MSERIRERVIERLQQGGMTKQEIAEELDVSRATVDAYDAHLTMDTYEGGPPPSKPSISRERDVNNHLVQNLDQLEPELELEEGGQEYNTDVGRIDILARDGKNDLVVIEIKRGEAGDAALGQIMGYMQHLSAEKENDVRGIIVAETFSERLKTAVNNMSKLSLRRFKVHFTYDSVSM